MAISAGISINAKVSWLCGEFHPRDEYKLALYSAKANITPFDDAYTTDGEVIGQAYQKGGVLLEGFLCGLDGTTACITWKVDPTWKNSTINARGGMIYNASKGNKPLAVFDFGKDVISTNGNWTFPMPKLSSTEALIRFE
jgi:hypothetical protein